MQNTNTPPIATIATEGDNLKIEIPLEGLTRTIEQEILILAIWLIYHLTGKPLGIMDEEVADLIEVNKQTSTKKRRNLGLRYRKTELPLVEKYIEQHGIHLASGLSLPNTQSKRKTRKKTTPCPT